MHSIHFSPIYRVHSKIGFLTQGIRRLLFQMDLGGGIITLKVFIPQIVDISNLLDGTDARGHKKDELNVAIS